MGLHHDSGHEHRETEPRVSAAVVARNVRVARLSVATALTLALAKMATLVLTGSLAIAASLMDSVMDVVASSVNFFAVRFAGVPADEEHHYGHGKAEGLAGVAQGLIIGVAGLYLMVEGAHRLVAGSSEITHTGIGIAVMLFSLVASAWIGWLLLHTAKQTGSVALRADAAHYTTDVWMNLGVLVALIAMKVTGQAWIDGVVSILVALIVVYAAVTVLRRSVSELMDSSLGDEKHAEILDAIAERVPEARDVHELRSRKSGPDIFVDLHVAFDRELSFPEAHLLSERVRRAIEDAVPTAQVHVHADPYPLLPEDEEYSRPSP